MLCLFYALLPLSLASDNDDDSRREGGEDEWNDEKEKINYFTVECLRLQHRRESFQFSLIVNFSLFSLKSKASHRNLLSTSNDCSCSPSRRHWVKNSNANYLKLVYLRAASFFAARWFSNYFRRLFVASLKAKVWSLIHTGRKATERALLIKTLSEASLWSERERDGKVFEDLSTSLLVWSTRNTFEHFLVIHFFRFNAAAPHSSSLREHYLFVARENNTQEIWRESRKLLFSFLLRFQLSVIYIFFLSNHAILQLLV